MSRIKWVAEVMAEYGGPAIVADASDYEKWTGNAPRPIEQRRTLHYWGQFTDELPAPYQEDGGHVHREADSYEAVCADRDALIVAIKSTFDGAEVTVDEEGGEAHVLLPDDRQMWIELGPKSQYEEACDGEAAWDHEFKTRRGDVGRAIFWDFEGAGAFYVGINDSRDEVVLLRTWVDKEEFDATAKAHVDSSPESEEVGEDIALHVGAAGKLVVGYSPHHWLTMLPLEQLEGLMAEMQAGLSKEEGLPRLLAAFRARLEPATGDQVVMLSTGDDDDVAAVLTIQPGTYSVAIGRFDPDDPGDDEDDDDSDDEDDGDDAVEAAADDDDEDAVEAAADDDDADEDDDDDSDDSDEDDDEDGDDPDASWSCVWCRFKRIG